MTTEGEWEQVLWKRQQFPDNYVHSSFLSALRRNGVLQGAAIPQQPVDVVRRYDYWSVLVQASAVTQHLCSISIFLSVFIHLHYSRLDPVLVIVSSLVAFVLGYKVWESAATQHQGVAAHQLRAKAAKSSILVILTLLALSPVLRTLTSSTSSDSIWAIAACLFALNALLTDYRASDSGRQRSGRLTSVISVNAALSSSVVLASRLSTDGSVFALVLFSVLLFGQVPMVRNRGVQSSAARRLLSTGALTFISIILASTASPLYGRLTCGVCMFATFGAPAALVWAQRFKNQIRGPWDVAALNL